MGYNDTEIKWAILDYLMTKIINYCDFNQLHQFHQLLEVLALNL